MNVTTDEERVKPVHGLTNNQAEYRALIYALLNLPRGAEAKIFSDSQLVVRQFEGDWSINDQRLRRLLNRAREVISERELKITVTWIPRNQNLAGKLLDRCTLM